MAAPAYLASALLLLCLVGTCYANVLLSTLPNTLIVTASPKEGEVLKARKSQITVTWTVNSTLANEAVSTYKTIKTRLCYAPISQKDRGWRKTVDNLKKDKTCQFLMSAKPYSTTNNTATYTVQAKIPQATYFVRAYAIDAAGVQVAYGQTTDAKKLTNHFQIEAITGRHVSLDIASIAFSVFSVASLAFFFLIEKKKAKVSK